jgi:exosortase A
MTDVIQSSDLFRRLSQEGSRQAVLAGVAILLWLTIFSLVFPEAARGAVRVWLASPTFNHCFLIMPLSVFLVWQRRATLVGLRPAPDGRAIAAILILALAWLGAFLSGFLEAQQFVVLTMTQAALFGVLGAVYYRKLLAPFLYLYFLVPSGSYLIPALQAFTARFAVAGLHLLRIPVFSNGSVIDIPAGTFAVAEACAGLRFLIAAVAFGVFFAVITYRSRARRLAFITLSVVIPIIANGFRALGLIAAAEWIGSPTAAMADHVLYGWIFFSLVLLMLVAIGNAFSDQQEKDVAHTVLRDSAPGNSSVIRVVLVGAGCMIAAAFAPMAVSLLPAPHDLALPSGPPAVKLPWRDVNLSPAWRPLVTNPARAFSQTFDDGTHQVERFVAVFAANGRSENIVRSNDRDADEHSWSFNSANTGELEFSGRPVPVRVSTWLHGSRKRVVWSFYVVNGRPIAGALQAKWEALRSYLTNSPCLPAYIALSTEVNDDKATVKSVGSLLAATQPLARYLCYQPNSAPSARNKSQ